MIEDVRKLILLLVNAERLGGRVQVVDGQTLDLYDCMTWDSFCSDAVIAHYPEVKISVRASRQSLSGFAVTFHVRRCSRRETVWYLVIGLSLACCGFILLRSPWWTSAITRI